jgi:hypothetical protein
MEYLTLKERLEFALTCKKHYNDYFMRITRCRRMSPQHFFKNRENPDFDTLTCSCGVRMTFCKGCLDSEYIITMCEYCDGDICSECCVPVKCFTSPCRCDGEHYYCKKCATKK